MMPHLLIQILKGSHLAPLATRAVEHLGQLGDVKIQRVGPNPQDRPMLLMKLLDMDMVVASSHEKEAP